MRFVTAKAHARAGLVGNPSDGYFGKTISLIVRNFTASVVVYEWDQLEIIPPPNEGRCFDSLDHLAEHVERNGYYGATRLVKAAIIKFRDYCLQCNVTLPKQNFSLRYETDIPRGVGLAGSSAIVTAVFRGLMAFYGVEIPREELPNWILATEREQLRIQAGLQDRVAQVYEGLTFMDFDRAKMERDGFGTYIPLDPAQLPPLYLAYRTALAEPSDVVHNDLRERFDAGDASVLEAMKQFAALTVKAREALQAGRADVLAACVDANFDWRRRIMAIAPGHLKMVETARSCGASAHFAGSGGTIAGTYTDEACYARLQRDLAALGCRVIKPQVA